MWSLHDLPCRNPACSGLSFLSSAPFNLPSITLHRTLLGMDSRVIPRHFFYTGIYLLSWVAWRYIGGSRGAFKGSEPSPFRQKNFTK
jgi:hypothetical protein